MAPSIRTRLRLLPPLPLGLPPFLPANAAGASARARARAKMAAWAMRWVIRPFRFGRGRLVEAVGWIRVTRSPFGTSGRDPPAHGVDTGVIGVDPRLRCPPNGRLDGISIPIRASTLC